MNTQNQATGTQLTIKGIVIGVLVLLLLIPTFFISGIVDERMYRERDVREELSNKWASDQTVVGPFIMIPFRYKEFENVVSNSRSGYLYIMPDDLKITGNLKHDIRKRSLFEVIVYQSELQITGNFSSIAEQITSLGKELELDKARICFGISDYKGIENEFIIDINGKKISLDERIATNRFVDNGLSAPIQLSKETLQYDFQLKVNLKGMTSLYFAPVGKTTTAELQATWPHPKFDGSFLPATSTINDKGFTANWSVFNLNRTYPQSWSNNDYSSSNDLFGVILFQPANSYAKTDRAIKYALLFIGLTFAFYFFIEVLQRRKIHPIQYILVGIALCVFYTLLLSISEYLNFNLAYLIAAFATVSLITFYTYTIFKDLKVAAIFGVVISFLYGFIFALIQLEDGALLFGSIGLFILLAIMMYYSRRIDWYGQNNKEQTIE